MGKNNVFDIEFGEGWVRAHTAKGRSFLETLTIPASARENYLRAWEAGMQIEFSSEAVRDRLLSQEVVDGNTVCGG